MRRILGVGLVLVGLVTVVDAARGQDEPRYVQLDGTVTALKPGPDNSGVFEIKASDKKTYFVKVEPKKTKIKVAGTALPNFLKPGLFVRFTAFLTRNAVKEPVSSMQLFIPEEGYQTGVFKDNPEDKKSDSLVAAQIKSIKNGKLMMLSVGNQQIKVTLADECEIEVEVSDFTLARPGDKIEVKGRVVEEPDQVAANDVDITLVEPLSAPEDDKKKKPARAAKKKPAAEEKDEAAEEDEKKDDKTP